MPTLERAGRLGAERPLERLAKSNTSSAVAAASGATNRGPPGERAHAHVMIDTRHGMRLPDRARQIAQPAQIGKCRGPRPHRLPRSRAPLAPSDRRPPVRGSETDRGWCGVRDVARSPRAVSRCHSATSLPTPSPSAFTCVVSATRRPGASTAATASAARTRSGESILRSWSCIKYIEASSRGVTQRRHAEARALLPRPYERQTLAGHGTAHREAVVPEPYVPTNWVCRGLVRLTLIARPDWKACTCRCRSLCRSSL